MLTQEEKRKREKLRSLLLSMESAVIAFSGGVDSSFLLKTAADALGSGKILAVTAESATYPANELKFAGELARKLGVKPINIKTDELASPDFTPNPHNRCYFCKIELFSKLEALRKKHGFKHVIDGSNYDDIADYRPGAKAAEELGVRSPLKEAGLTKREIRNLSKAAGLSTWDKPALACLASRIPYGETITAEKLKRIEKAESFLRAKGIKQVRVRSHGAVARIEADDENIPVILDGEFRKKTAGYFKKLGFNYVTVDIEGYRTGSMNEVLKPEDTGAGRGARPRKRARNSD